MVFSSTEGKGSYFEQSTVEPANIPKGYTQAASSTVQTAPNFASHSDEIICSFFAQQASMPATHDDEDLLQIDEDAMEEIDIRWQVAMITARIRKFMRKTGRPIDHHAKHMGITYDNMEFDAEHVHVGQDGLSDFDWSNTADDTPVSLALMAINTENEMHGVIRFGVESSSGMESDNSSGNTNSTESLYPNFQKTKGFHSVPPPTGTIIPPRANVSFTGIDELAIRNKVVNQEKTKTSQPEIDRNKVIIEDWVDSDDEETDFSEIQKKTVLNSENSETFFENKNSETSFENKSPTSQNSVGQGSRKMGVGHKGGSAIPKFTTQNFHKAILEEDLKDYANIANFKSLSKSSHLHLSKGTLDDQLQEMSISWKKTWYLGNEEANNLCNLLYRNMNYVQLQAVVLESESMTSHTIAALVVWQKILISEETIRADLLFDDANGVDCFPKQVIWDVLRDIWLRGSSQQKRALAGIESRNIFKSSSRAASSARDAQGTPTQNAAQTSISTAQDTAGTQGTAPAQDTTEVQADPFFEDIVDKDAAVTPDFERKSDETEEINVEEKEGSKSVDTEALERKSDETEAINVEEKEGSNVKSGDTEELDLETFQSTARQSTITPRTLDFDNEAGPSSPIRSTQNIEPEEQFEVDKVLADISRPRGLSIPGPIQSQPQPQQPTQGTDSKDKGKGILVEEPKKKKLTLQQIRALETTNDEEVARKIQAEWDAEEERKRFEELKKAKPKTTLRKPTSLAQERNQMMNFLKGQGYKAEDQSKKVKLRRRRLTSIRKYLRIIDFEKNAQIGITRKGISMITELQVIDSPDGEYLIIHRANNHFRAFDTLWEILHILDRQDLYHLYRVVQDYYEHIPPTGLGLILLGDLTTIWETAETSVDDFWKNQEDWEIVRWRLNESSGVHTLELEDGTMIHMLAERRYPLSRELMIRMLEHGMEVEDENETAITLIHLFILWTTEGGDNS
ncbi:hypothetical protein Tco_0751763 [Tanacetum coccineum]|uniref:Uncharacterized protein n=1 Tax=Tanacetum coccineum TaxID=301880 RepID=A0ABQ4Z7S4_9ASTR